MERNNAIDYFKCFAVFLVVGLHTVTFSSEWQANPLIVAIITFFPRWVIPFFFMVSGYLFGRKILTKPNSFEYFKKYLFKLIGLFILWYIFYLVYDLLVRVLLAMYMGFNIKDEVYNYVKSISNIDVIYYGVGITSFHLWYLTALIWSIIILFLFIKLKRLSFLLIISLVLNIIGLFGQTYSSVFQLPIQTRDALFFGLFYTTLGGYFAFHLQGIMGKVKHIKLRFLIYVFIFFSVIQIVEIVITVNVFNGTKEFGEYYLSTIFLTITLFLIAVKNSRLGENTVGSRLGQGAVGIYVSHLFFISIITLSLNLLNWESLRQYIWFNLILAVVVFLASYYFFFAFNAFNYKIWMSVRKKFLFRHKKIRYFEKRKIN